MKINRDNYALFFLDFFEGVLPEGDREELMRFLELHPDLKEEFDDFEMVRLPGDEQVRFPDKMSLKKEAVPDDHEMLFAAYVEGDLNDADARRVEEMAASDPRYERELALMKRTKLEPATEAFPGKQSLKQFVVGAPGAVVPFMARISRKHIYYATSAAAAVLLLALVTFTLFTLRDHPQVAIHDGDPAVRNDLPVGGEVEQPGAVAEAPAPPQELDPEAPWGTDLAEAMPFVADPSVELPTTDPAIVADPTGEALVTGPAIVTDPTGEAPAADPSIVPDPTGEAPAIEAPPSTEPIRERIIDRFRDRPLIAGRIDSREAHGIVQPTATVPGALDERKEYRWLAYRDPSERPSVTREDEPVASPGSREVTLAQLAVNQIEERTDIDFREVGNVVASSEFSFRELAGRGLSGLNNLMGQPIVVDGETTTEGRRVQFAIGSFIEVSRSSPEK